MLVGENGGGTGFGIVSPTTGKHYILTNKHVCEVATEVRSEEGPAYVAQKIVVAEYTDLCLLEAGYLTSALELASSYPEAHDPIHILGYGYLLGNTLTEGHYVGRIYDSILGVMFPAYATAPILPGNSGSPVINDSGEVVGVVYASGAEIDYRALIVPLEDIYQILEGH
jgi:serine protease Do